MLGCNQILLNIYYYSISMKFSREKIYKVISIHMVSITNNTCRH